MSFDLTLEQKSAAAKFRAFAEKDIGPVADLCDREERIPPELIKKIADAGFFRTPLPTEYGGEGADMITYGLLHEEFGRQSASVQGLLNVHNMSSQAMLRWGKKAQKSHWLPKIAAGEKIAAIAITEPNVGSDAKSVGTNAVLSGDCYVIDGEKQWISFAQIADIFVLLAKCDGNATAFLLEAGTPGLTIEPIRGMIGCRGYMLGGMRLSGCRIPRENVLGSIGFGAESVVATSLDVGRYCLAWGCVGLVRACFEACVRYANERKQFGELLKEHQLIQLMMANMATELEAAGLLCHRAGQMRDAGDPGATLESAMAKYFASGLANRAAHDAVQLHGARGCSNTFPLERYLRDAKITEIIEGTSQIHQLIIGRRVCQEPGRP